MFREMADRMRAAKERMISNREADALRIANDAKALAQLRIQTSGRNYQNAAFSPYSQGHKRTRKKAGAQVSYVDFTITGELWRRVVAQVIGTTDKTVTVEITAPDRLNQAKLQGALKSPKRAPRGNILKLSEEEERIISEANADIKITYFRDA